jgi:hypothetical protein
MAPSHEPAHGAEQTRSTLGDAKRLREVFHYDLHRVAEDTSCEAG